MTGIVERRCCCIFSPNGKAMGLIIMQPRAVVGHAIAAHDIVYHPVILASGRGLFRHNGGLKSLRYLFSSLHRNRIIHPFIK